jgi:4-amino-4-deoxy-L-arabinose transferase-like glycosyltransferase
MASLAPMYRDPEATHSAAPERRWDTWLLAVLAVSAALGLYQLDWGLAFGTSDWTHSWTVDAMEPLTALGIVHKSFGSWNSGWFYFKYPLGYPLLLSAALSPYLGYLTLTGQIHRVASTYPYGFSKPEHALFVLAMIQRLLNVAFVVGTVALVYGIGRRLFGKHTGYLAAWFAATCYPVVYYAHTSNVDASYVFWMTLALYAAVVASETDKTLPWTGLGLAAAMALSTKEQAFGFLLPLPLLALAVRVRAYRSVRACWSRPALVMVAAAVLTVLVANNILFNPLGFVARIAFLLGHPLKPVDVPLKPVEFAWFKGGLEWTYLRQLWGALDSGFGLPLACLVLAGAVLAVWQAPRISVWLLLPMGTYYYLSLRGQQLVTLRYSLPFLLPAATVAAALLDALRTRPRHAALRGGAAVLIVGLGVLALGRGIELDLLLRGDARHQAETWMRAHVPDGARGEIYQKPTYLPRFPRRLQVNYIAMEQRSVEEFQQRRPDYVVLSSASRKSISHIWNPDWRTTRTLLLEVPDAARFVAALRDGSLGYHRVAGFRQHPQLLRVSTTGLCPEITIYARDGGTAPALRGADSAPPGAL